VGVAGGKGLRLARSAGHGFVRVEGERERRNGWKRKGCGGGVCCVEGCTA
jgi:hypothetical protein